eukprot:7743812-Alexandrium_andersonii.AAC.1
MSSWGRGKFWSSRGPPASSLQRVLPGPQGPKTQTRAKLPIPITSPIVATSGCAKDTDLGRCACRSTESL